MTRVLRERIIANLSAIRQRIAMAAEHANRHAESIRLVAVTKQANRAQIEALILAGCSDFAESRPQQLWERARWFPDACWHLVGHLQRNKVDQTLLRVHWIHSVDSDRLLATIHQQSQMVDNPVSLLLQVNISQEPNKHGWAPEQMLAVGESLSQYPKLEVRGLMGMATQNAPLDQLHREFATLRELAEQLRERGLVPADFRELSMGMSDDYPIAIEEGATMVRIGSALWEGTVKPE